MGVRRRERRVQRDWRSLDELERQFQQPPPQRRPLGKPLIYQEADPNVGADPAGIRPRNGPFRPLSSTLRRVYQIGKLDTPHVTFDMARRATDRIAGTGPICRRFERYIAIQEQFRRDEALIHFAI